MLNRVHTDAPVPEPSPECTVQQLEHDYHHLLAQLRRRLRPVLEHIRAAPALSPEAVLRELLWPVAVQPKGAAPMRQALEVLTVQECRIAKLIAQGLSTEAIAAQLYIAPSTVKVHRRNMRKKLGLVGPQHRLQPYLARQAQPPTPGGQAT
jgi:DNA-binding CsgD family transcriptional regulator